jgi:hypothetical protein
MGRSLREMGGLLMPGSDAKKDSGFDITTVVQEVGKFTRKVDSLSKAVDYVAMELMPQIFGDKVDEVYRSTRKTMDYFIKFFL